ncbi:MAG: nucleoside kinase [Lachnospiraceae bacterium]|nr:nucleoside kinase [Lachnospiraceae bacterium]
MVKIEVAGKVREYPFGTTYQEIAKDYQEQFEDDILLALFNEKLQELHKSPKRDGKLEFLTAKQEIGRKTYRRCVSLLLQKAVDSLYGSEGVSVRMRHSLGQGYYCTLKGNERPVSEMVLPIKIEMMRLVDEDLIIEKKSLKTDEAIELFAKRGMHNKERLFGYRISSRVNVYDLDGYIDYFYGYMVPSTGYLKYFDLIAFDEGIMLLFPNENTKVVAEFHPSYKLYQTLQESEKWGEMLNIDTVGALNDAIASGKIQEMIMVQEALMEKKIGQLAEEIADKKDKKFVMIAGPSSSGKTTFSYRLSTQLMAQGLKPHPIGLDNYYVDRDKTPRDENGDYDFECLEALDIEQFNQDMTRLFKGERVEIPTFNFKAGKREYKGNFLQLGADDILVIEGIHGLNDKLSYSLPKESKFKIYISALTQLNIDEHNHLPTTDARLLRRIVRDSRTRGTNAQETIAMWPSVRRGEEKHIFPFQEEADAMFNSALIYELSVLKAYAQPQLCYIRKDCPEYLEAKRLLKFLDYFLPVPTEDIPKNSILREFIGGSCLDV